VGVQPLSRRFARPDPESVLALWRPGTGLLFGVGAPDDDRFARANLADKIGLDIPQASLGVEVDDAREFPVFVYLLDDEFYLVAVPEPVVDAFRDEPASIGDRRAKAATVMSATASSRLISTGMVFLSQSRQVSTPERRDPLLPGMHRCLLPLLSSLCVLCGETLSTASSAVKPSLSLRLDFSVIQ
jgi:hypothetical protein